MGLKACAALTSFPFSIRHTPVYSPDHGEHAEHALLASLSPFPLSFTLFSNIIACNPGWPWAYNTEADLELLSLQSPYPVTGSIPSFLQSSSVLNFQDIGSTGLIPFYCPCSDSFALLSLRSVTPKPQAIRGLHFGWVFSACPLLWKSQSHDFKKWLTLNATCPQILYPIETNPWLPGMCMRVSDLQPQLWCLIDTSECKPSTPEQALDLILNTVSFLI